MEIDLHDRRVLVTGASSGLGRAMCLAFAACGARVAINHLHDEVAADAVAGTVMADGGDAIVIEADVASEPAVEAMFARVDAAWGGVDVLVNNAGIDGPRALGWEAEARDWKRVLDINLAGAWLGARQALRRMVAQRRGVVLNTTSVHERIAWSGYSAYAASKAGLSMMAKSLALEAAPSGVRVLCIAPGAIRTPINESVWKDPAGRADLLSKIPMGRIGEPEDVAHVAAFLASDLGAYMTATTVYVDGGMTDYPGFAHGG